MATLNLGSGDVNYALKANFPFYVEQKDQQRRAAVSKSGRYPRTAARRPVGRLPRTAILRSA